MSDLEELVGLNILGVEANDDHTALRFTVEGRDALVFYADGDCCSSSWVAHIEGVSRLQGVVRSVEGLSLSRDEYEEDHDYVKVYGYGINTDKGTAVIDFRNRSNGYYGGSLSLVEGCVAPKGEHYHYFYGGVWGQNNPANKWEVLDSDF